MPINNFDSWYTTAASNTDLGGISILGNAPVSNFDGALREMMKQLKAGVLSLSGGTVTGTLAVKNTGSTDTIINFQDSTGARRMSLTWFRVNGSIAVTNYASDGTTVVNSLAFPGTTGDASYNADTMTTSGNLMAQYGAQISAGGVGAIQLLAHGTANTVLTYGGTYAGSALRLCSLYGTSGSAATLGISGTAPSGTWRCLGSLAAIAGNQGVSLFVRVA